MSIRSSYKDSVQNHRSMKKFAHEVIQLLTENVHRWIECPKYFIIDHPHLENPVIFTDDIQKAVLISAYFLQTKSNLEDFRNVLPDLKNSKYYTEYITHCIIPERTDFSTFITWVATVCLCTIFMYQEGYFYFKESRMCLAKYLEFEYFKKAGGWKALRKHTVEKVRYYERIAAVLRNEENDDKISNLINTVENLQKRERYLRNAWMFQNPDMPLKDTILSNASNKYSTVMNFGSRRVSSAYIVVLTNVFQEATDDCHKSGKESIIINSSNIIEKSISKKAYDTTSVQMDQKMDSFAIASTSNAMDGVTTFNTNLESRDELDDTNSIFVVGSLFMTEREETKHAKPPYIRVIKIRSSTGGPDKISLNLTKLLDKHLKNNLYRKASKGVFTVGPSKYRDDGNSRIVVIDTSEEEDDVLCFNDFTTHLNSTPSPPNKTGIHGATQSGSQDGRRFKTGKAQSESDASGHSSKMTKPQSTRELKRKSKVKENQSGKKRSMAQRSLRSQLVQARSTFRSAFTRINKL